MWSNEEMFMYDDLRNEKYPFLCYGVVNLQEVVDELDIGRHDILQWIEDNTDYEWLVEDCKPTEIEDLNKLGRKLKFTGDMFISTTNLSTPMFEEITDQFIEALRKDLK